MASRHRIPGGVTLGLMTPTEFDFSDIIFVNDEWPRSPKPIDGLNDTDSAIVRWMGKLVASRADGSLQIEFVAWFVARLLSMGGVLVWLGQDQKLLEAGLQEIFGESAELVPEPWAGFLRWASDPSNVDGFRAWPAYSSTDNLEAHLRPRDRQRKPAPRRRR